MSGKLTAEQVHELIAPHLDARPTFDFGRHGAVWSADFQAIADELNAALGGECEMVTSGTPCEGNTDKACTACGAYNIGEFYDGQSHRAAPKFCPNCGRPVKGGL